MRMRSSELVETARFSTLGLDATAGLMRGVDSSCIGVTLLAPSIRIHGSLWIAPEKPSGFHQHRSICSSQPSMPTPEHAQNLPSLQ